MAWTSMLAIFGLFWVLSAFLVMPFGLRTLAEDEGREHDRVAGQIESAPANFRPLRIALRATVLAAILFGLFYLNYINGWLGTGDLTFLKPPAEIAGEND